MVTGHRVTRFLQEGQRGMGLKFEKIQKVFTRLISVLKHNEDRYGSTTTLMTLKTALNNTHTQRVARGALWLIESAPRIPNPDPRRTRLLASFLLFMTIGLLFTFTADQWSPAAEFSLSILVILSVVSFQLNRYGHYLASARLVVAMLSIVPFTTILASGQITSSTVANSFLWTPMALFAAYVLLPMRSILFTAAANVAAIGLFVGLPMVSGSTLQFVAFFNFVFGLMLSISAVARHHEMKNARRAAEALAETEMRYRDLFDATMEGIVIHENGRVRDVNPACERMLGYTRDEMIGQHVFAFVDKHDPVTHEAVYSFHDNRTYEIIILPKGGKRLSVEVQGGHHHYQGKLMRVVAVRDITERKAVEAQRIELAMEREKVEVLQRFIGDMSHDLKTPLSVIKTSVYMVGRVAHDPDGVRRQAAKLDQQTDHLVRVLDDLLSMSRLDRSDGSDYEFVPSDANLLLMALINDEQAAALPKRIRLSFLPTPGLPTVDVDEEEFARMIKHLLMNAMTYTPEGGQVTLATSLDDQDHDTLCIEVRDTGAGIQAADLPRIFDRFYRADRARGTHTGGTGVGLSIARKIAEAHGGSIEAESVIGQGSVFRVRLPVALAIPTTSHASLTP